MCHKECPNNYKLVFNTNQCFESCSAHSTKKNEYNKTC